MRVTFLGTGEAFGERATTSLLVNNELLLDCGPSTVSQLRKLGVSFRDIGIVVLTHLHADHCFGLPALLLGACEDERREKLIILTPQTSEEALRLGYNRRYSELSFGVEEALIAEGRTYKLRGYVLSFARTKHSFESYAVRVEAGGKVLVYTGDGKPTAAVEELARGCDLLVAEAYGENYSDHSSALEAAKLARDAKAKVLAVVHLRRDEREEQLSSAAKVYAPILVPSDLSTVFI